MSDFCYSPMFPVSKDKTEYIKISDNFVNVSKVSFSGIIDALPSVLVRIIDWAIRGLVSSCFKLEAAAEKEVTPPKKN